MNNDLEPIKETNLDYAHRFVKGALGAVPFAGTFLGEVFSVILPPSIESRRDKWMKEVSIVLNDLMTKNDNFLNELKDNEDFISLLLEASQLALKTHREEKLQLYGRALKNSLSIDIDFFIQETYVRYIAELNPNQILILDFIETNQENLIAVNSYQKYYNILTEGTISLSPTLRSSVDSSTVRFFLQELDKKGLIIISDAIEELEGFVRDTSYLMSNESNESLPYIKVTEFGKNFLKMIEENT